MLSGTIYSTIFYCGLSYDHRRDNRKLEKEIAGTRFSYLVKVCTQYFGEPRIKGSHHIFKTPWIGDPRLNLQSDKGKAKPYQVEQVIAALKKLENIKELSDQ